MIGSRHPEAGHLTAWKEAVGKRASIGNTTDAAKFGDLLIVAVNWSGVEEVLHHARPLAAGKIVIDVTNPLEFNGTTPPVLAVGHDMSGGEIVQQLINYAHMCQPKYYEGTPAMFYCGNNHAAKEVVAKILDALGWKDATDLGDIKNSRLLEPMCLLWVTYGMVHNSWDHAFGVLKR
jgi:predicted dinucleotide-binding enzyme